MNYSIKNIAFTEIDNIYHHYMMQHFPADELKPLKSIYRMWQEGQYCGLGFYKQNGSLEEGDLLGYAFFVLTPPSQGGMLLLDYFAILEDYRSLGIGGSFLKEMKGFFPDYKGILIETEDADYAQDVAELAIRQKRDSFYARNGAIKTGIKTDVYGVHYVIWNLPIERASSENILEEHFSTESPSVREVSSDNECRTGIKEVYRIILPHDKFEKHFHFLN